MSTTSPRATIRLLVVDDHPVVVDGLAVLLRADASIEIVGAAATAREAAELARDMRPDVVLLDLRLPDGLGVDAIPVLRAAVPGVRIILFTAHAQHAGIEAALSAGVQGVLLKDAGVPDVVDAIHRVMDGEQVVDERIRQCGHRQSGAGVELTRREYEVLRLAAVGRTNIEIASELGLMRSTVKGYLQSVMQKLDARNRVEAIAHAHEAFLL
jgi:two-component system nitrate/nitrite response regulator NarL